MSDAAPTTTALERAIRSEPDELQRVLDMSIAHDTVERLRKAHRIWLVGTGTSQHAAELGASMFHDAGRGADAMSSMHFVNWAPPIDPRDAVILISHNAGAETAYAWSAYTMSIGAGMRVLAITRQGAALAEAIETVAQERSHTYSVSYSAVLLVLARLAGGLGAESCSPEVLARIPGAVRDAVDRPGTEGIAQPNRLLLLFGEGPASVTAREGALKLREASRFPAEGYDVEYLLHGSAVPLTADDHLVSLSPPDSDGLVEAVAKAAEAEGIGVTRVVEHADLPPILAQIPLVTRLQLLALRFATERGQNPDLVIERAWAGEELWAIGSFKGGSGPV
jgi:glucosamine--fructose-6-phosphate aminotransferase (isomerizing)